MASPAPITGSCLCRALRYTVDLPSVAYPPTKHVCQCTMCRKHSGAILVPFIVLQQSHVYWGDPASKIVLKDLISANQSTYAEYESSLGRFRGFCSRCGSTMLWRSTLPPEGGESEDEFEILAGTIDEHILLGNVVQEKLTSSSTSKRDGTGRAHDLIVPDYLFHWKNSTPEYVDFFGNAKMFYEGSTSETVIDEDRLALKNAQ